MQSETQEKVPEPEELSATALQGTNNAPAAKEEAQLPPAARPDVSPILTAVVANGEASRDKSEGQTSKVAALTLEDESSDEEEQEATMKRRVLNSSFNDSDSENEEKLLSSLGANGRSFTVPRDS